MPYGEHYIKMKDSTRLIVNTLAQNVRTLLNIVLSLYSTRLVMDALGQSDYGIYMLVAGIVSLLSYFVNALVTTTQRHLSYSYGKKDIYVSKSIFANSYILHWAVALVLGFVALTLTNVLFDYGWLNIPLDKICEAKFVYIFVVSSVFLTFINAPFRALLIAHENIVYLSLVDVLDGILKLGLVFSLYLVEQYRLPLYAAIIAIIMFVNLLLLAGYAKIHYEDCILIPRLKYYKWQEMQKIVGFATWTLYGTFCVFIRTQGLAVILNRIYGTIINAAFGVATQVFGSIQFLSEAILNAIRPQIIKAEGTGDRTRMIYLSECASKFCFLMLAIVSVPLIIEMPQILRLWLGEVPAHAIVFCRTLMFSSLIDQLTIGLGIANAAIGNIRNYTITTFSIKASTVVVVWLLLVNGYTIGNTMMIYVIFELISSLIRIPFLVKTANLKVFPYIKNVYGRILIPFVTMVLTSLLLTQFQILGNMRFLATTCASGMVGLCTIYLFGITGQEKAFLKNLITKKINKDYKYE